MHQFGYLTPSWPRSLLLVLVLLGTGIVTPSTLHAQEEIDDVTFEEEWMKTRRKTAAEYVLERLAYNKPVGYDEAAKSELLKARQALAVNELRDANNISWEAYNDYIYSDYADDLLHLSMSSAIARGNLRRTHRYIADLWFRFPNYDNMEIAFEEALKAADFSQRRNTKINLDAETPKDIIEKGFWTSLEDSEKIFRFLALHGDRRKVGPRASLGIARSLAIKGASDKESLFAAREAYVDFITNYPRSDLMFEALSEQALTHLLGYRGAAFDGAALINSEYLINQAAFYVKNDPFRQETVSKIRGRIAAWRQDKELFVADWYREKDEYAAAAYYYREVIKRDSGSNQGQTASRALADISEYLADEAEENTTPPQLGPNP